MKRINCCLLIVLLLWGCQKAPESQAVTEIQEETHTDSKGEQSMQIVIKNKTFDIVLYDNETVEALCHQLPMTITMDELNGNEKYHYLDQSLPTQTQSVDHIKAGDIMLYGNNCLVVFYKDFQTSYQYTKIGHIKDTDGFTELLGTNSIEMTLQKQMEEKK